MILCNECGNPLDEGTRVCAECGAQAAVGHGAGHILSPVRDPPTAASRDVEFWQSIESSEVENRFWEAIDHSDEAENFRKYLKAYPNGTFAVIARNKLLKLAGRK